MQLISVDKMVGLGAPHRVGREVGGKERLEAPETQFLGQWGSEPLSAVKRGLSACGDGRAMDTGGARKGRPWGRPPTICINLHSFTTVVYKCPNS